MPTIHDASPTAVLDCVDLVLVSTWEQHPGEKLLALPFDTIAYNVDTHADIGQRILTAVVEITQSKDAGVAVPKPSKNAIRTRTTPSTFLIHNLTTPQKLTLLRCYVWSSQAISFHILPLSPPCLDFLFGIQHFTTMNEDEVYKVVYKVWHNDKSEKFITLITNSVPGADHSTTETNLCIFIALMYMNHLNIKGTGNTLTPQFNIYTNGSVIHNDQTWAHICAFFAGRSYEDQLLSQASTVVYPFNCSLCQSINHPCRLCPFPEIEGWNGPQRCTAGNRVGKARGCPT